MALTPDSFASATDMENRSGGAVTTTSHPFLETELKAATRAIRNACGWHIAGKQQVSYERTRSYAEQVWLPAMEIASIDEVTIDGQTVTPAEVVSFDGTTGWTNLRGRVVKVTYTAGFTEVPEDLIVLTLELAAGALASKGLGITREQAGGVSVSLARVTGALTIDDANRLAAYKIGYVP